MKKYLDEKTKKSIWDVVTGYKKKREGAIEKLGVSEEQYKEKVSKIREKVFVDFEKDLEQAKARLRENGFVLHEASDAQEAREIIAKLTKNEGEIVKTKSNTGREIEIEKALEGKDFSETDLGDAIVELFKQEDQHYVLPAIHITAEQIAEKIEQKYGEKIEADPEKLTHFLCGKIREKILHASVGITGVNFFTKTGQLVLLENEGNISLVSRVPAKHIAIVGIDKLVESVEDATELCRTSAVFGTGQDITQYISIISGPSKTADIENKLVLGAQGAHEAHIVLLDNGRRKMLTGGFGDLLRCINCGACINFCPVYHQEGNKYGGEKYIGSKGIVSTALREGLLGAKDMGSFHCTLCGNCAQNCPMKIPLDEMVRRVREMQNEQGLQTDPNREMLEKTKKYGNPFGQAGKDQDSGELYCC